ncbi:ATP-binding cassette glutathione S-conjugate transporter ycf1 [Coemansia sp. RSA 552]|nr:ATP-binding cassette glutathione S-conjugate transporter ycf1 [Coemansia sp. RSA 552]
MAQLNIRWPRLLLVLGQVAALVAVQAALLHSSPRIRLQMIPAIARALAVSLQLRGPEKPEEILGTSAGWRWGAAAVAASLALGIRSQAPALLLVDLWLVLSWLPALAGARGTFAHATGLLESLADRLSYVGVFRYLCTHQRIQSSAEAEASLPPLRRSLHPARSLARFNGYWQSEVSSGRLSLGHALFWTFARDLLACSLIRLAVNLRDVLQPIAVARMLHELGQASADDPSPARCIWALSLYVVLSLAISLLEQNQIDMRDRVRLSMSTTLTCAIHQTHTLAPARALDADKGMGGSSVGRLAQAARSNGTDLYSCGTQSTQALAQHITKLVDVLWAPAKLVAGVYIFYRQVGWAVLPGIAAALLYLPLRGHLLTRFSSAKTRASAAASKRVSLLSQFIDNIVPVRMLGWTDILMDRIQSLRESHELPPTIHASSAMAVLSLFWTACRTGGSLVSLIIYTIVAQRSSAAERSSGVAPVERVFIVQTILEELLPQLINVPHVFDSWWAAERPYLQIKTLLLHRSSFGTAGCPDITDKPAASAKDPAAVSMTNATFTWSTYNDDEGTRFMLRGIDLRVHEKQLVAVVGKVGAGKSSLLSAILGEMELSAGGQLAVNGRLAYVSQDPWVMSGSVRDNITFGLPFDAPWFDKVIDLCELQHDLDQWAMGDSTLVGAGGSSLSGGQRMRVALARAVYSRASVYLLDDILAAVDATVGRRLVQRVLLGTHPALLKSAKIVVAKDPAVLRAADAIYVVEGGRISSPCKYDDLAAGPQQGLIATLGINNSAEPDMQQSAAALLDKAKDVESDEPEAEPEHAGNSHPAAPIKYILGLCGKRMVAAQCLTVAAQCVIAHKARLWMGRPLPHQRELDTAALWSPMAMHLATCVALWAGDVGLELAATLWTEVVWRRAVFSKSHHALLKSIAHAPLHTFAQMTPGSILALFTQNQRDMDTQLPNQLGGLLTYAIKFVFEIWIIVAFHPVLVVTVTVAVGAMMAMSWLSSGPLKHIITLQSETLPLIDEQYHESVSGAVTIRAFEAGHFVHQQLVDRIARYMQAQRFGDEIETWIDLNMTVLRELAISVAFGTALAGTLLPTLGLRIDPARMSLVHISVLLLAARLQHLIRNSHSIRASLVSANRYIAATNLAATDVPLKQYGSGSWPKRNEVVFDSVSAAYSTGRACDKAPMVLRGMTFAIGAGEHIGIVGRTGSGKTSIAMALLGLLRPSEGRILVGSVDMATVPTTQVHKHVGIVPQTTYVLPGTLRDNIDPRGQHSDDEIQRVLDTVGLAAACLKDTGAQTWSAGQKQLLGLARALIFGASILVLDEATSSIDPVASQGIHQAIRRYCRDRRCTVITIAHRIDAVMQCDRVLVIRDGSVCEEGLPAKLRQSHDSVFAQMIRRSGIIN